VDLATDGGHAFHISPDGTLYWIADRQDPGKSQWKVDLGTKDANGRPVVGQDYALISRFLNPRTGKMVVVVAGLYAIRYTKPPDGFLTDAGPDGIVEGGMFRRTGKRRTCRSSISTEVIDRIPGPARVFGGLFLVISGSAILTDRYDTPAGRDG